MKVYGVYKNGRGLTVYAKGAARVTAHGCVEQVYVYGTMKKLELLGNKDPPRPLCNDSMATGFYKNVQAFLAGNRALGPLWE